MQRDQTSNPRLAFTLVEILVVIAIIAILAALLLPSFAKAKQKAYQSKCLSNLKQIGYAINLYADDHEDRLPGPVWNGVYYVYNDEPERMPYYLAKYLSLRPPSSTMVNTAAVMICPWGVIRNRPEPPGTPANSLARPVTYVAIGDHSFGYPFSSPRSPYGQYPDVPPKKLIEITSPSASAAITDGDQRNAFWSEPYYPLLSNGQVHGRARNQLFFDWHVEAVRQ